MENEVEPLVSQPHPRHPQLPSTYGCHLWNYLAQFGRCWTKKTHWLAAVSHVSDCLHPSEPGNNGSGCARCHEHWTRLIQMLPPSKVDNALEAAVWVHFVHNQVNRIATPPKPMIPYNQAAALPGYGWALLDDATYFALLEKFGAKIVISGKAESETQSQQDSQ